MSNLCFALLAAPPTTIQSVRLRVEAATEWQAAVCGVDRGGVKERAGRSRGAGPQARLGPNRRRRTSARAHAIEPPQCALDARHCSAKACTVRIEHRACNDASMGASIYR